MTFSLFKTLRGKDFKFIDKMVRQQFWVGGTVIIVHKYLGPADMPASGDATQPGGTTGTETTIQDLLFLETRDRKYSPDLIELKGHYTLNDMEFNLSQFGLMLAGNNLFISFHLNEMLERLGRAIMAGDVFEIVHRRDDMLLNEALPAINAFYVVTDAARSAEGYSPTWYSHIWRTKAEPVTDSQEFADILNSLGGTDAALSAAIAAASSTAGALAGINAAIVAQATSEVPYNNMDSSHFYIRTEGDMQATDNLIPWIYNSDGVPMNSNVAAPGGRFFPQSPNDGDYFLRTDYVPSRLFKRECNRWVRVEDNWRTQWQNAHRVLVDHINDTKVTTVGPNPDDTFPERQAMSNVVPNKTTPPIADDNINLG